MAEQSTSCLAHNVYFTLNDASPAAQQQLVDECHKYLLGHPGEVFFAAGTLVSDLSRPVNDKAFHVGLHVVFDSRKAHDDYQQHPRHIQFIEANKSTWKQVRVFDSYVN